MRKQPQSMGGSELRFARSNQTRLRVLTVSADNN
jgi:hypothetical protein